MSSHHQQTPDTYPLIRLLWCICYLAAFAATLWLIGKAWGVN